MGKGNPLPRSTKKGRRSDFPRLLGGNLALDFVNTVEARSGEHPEEFLQSYKDLAHWGEHVALFSFAQAARLEKQAARVPKTAAAEFRKTQALREALYRIFFALARGENVSQADLADLQSHYIDALKSAQLSSTMQGYGWHWEQDINFATVGWRCAQAAVELLGSENLARVKECPNCGWLFLDQSKNTSRRWCSMEGCGSEVKSRRQYARQHRH